jgi:hypothetical protein
MNATPETMERSTFHTLRMQRDENELLAVKVEEISSRLQQVFARTFGSSS